MKTIKLLLLTAGLVAGVVNITDAMKRERDKASEEDTKNREELRRLELLEQSVREEIIRQHEEQLRRLERESQDKKNDKRTQELESIESSARQELALQHKSRLAIFLHNAQEARRCIVVAQRQHSVLVLVEPTDRVARTLWNDSIGSNLHPSQIVQRRQPNNVAEEQNRFFAIFEQQMQLDLAALNNFFRFAHQAFPTESAEDRHNRIERFLNRLPSTPPTDNSACSVCLENPTEAPDGWITLTCGHNFHKGCLLGWLMQNETCPICRGEAQSQAGTRR